MTERATVARRVLGGEDLARSFDDIKPPLDHRQALVESSRCHFCFDAPCIEACPTGIDIPGFIRKIGTGNLKGAAISILDENIMGGICARVCPTEILCEAACVRSAGEGKPVKIGLLQRHATDWLFAKGVQPFRRAATTGKRVAAIAGGPAGLGCPPRLPVGRRVVVIGGGNTAIDVAVQSKLLGAEDVTIVHRRGIEHMSATRHEREFAQTSGVGIKPWARPLRILGADGWVAAVEFEDTQLDAAGRPAGTGDRFTLAADMVFKAIGQILMPDPMRGGSADIFELRDGKIAVDDTRETSLSGVWAGGDCIAGPDLTVQAVEDGKIAAQAIDRRLRAT